MHADRHHALASRLVSIALTTLATLAFAVTTLAATPSPADARTFYVDYDAGSDRADGLSPSRPFRHAPGDERARASAGEVELAAGDRVIFKGGVHYRGTIHVTTSGSDGDPIVYDGNTAGDFGDGPAIIDGSVPIDGWRRIESIDEARGNPNWENIYVARAIEQADVFLLNLTQGDNLLSVARDPSPADPFFMDDTSTMRSINPPRPETQGLARIETVGLFGNSSHPHENMIDGSGSSFAIIDPMQDASITFHLPERAEARAFAITTDRRSTRPREIAFLVEGREIIVEELPNEEGRFEFELDAPVAFDQVTFEIRSIHGGDPAYGAIREIEAVNAAGNNVLRAGGEDPRTTYADPTFFTQDDPRAWDGAYFAIWAKPNRIYYQRVLGYVPERHEIQMEALKAEQYPDDEGLFALLNALSAITAPGEYYLSPDGDVYLWPLDAGPEGPENVSASRYDVGFRIQGQAHITIQGFIIQKQGGSPARGIHSSGGTRHLTIRDNEVRFAQSRGRDSAIAVVHGEHVRIENNYIHHNRNARGFRLTIADSVVTGNRLHKNGSTGIGFFGSERSEMTYNTVTGHTGVHANGLTVYANSRDILVEGNLSYSNGIALTLQDSANVTVRNNFLHHNGTVIGIWTGWHENLRIEHNVLVGPERHTSTWVAALFTNSDDIDGLYVHNNIMAGSSGNLPGEFSHNIYTRIGQSDDADNLPDGSQYVQDLRRLFENPAELDYRLRPGSPAIDAGLDLGIDRDLEGNPRHYGPAPDIGAYEYQGHE
ncbi:MAG: right-handed parallel beta-helix repeat-containing protein [Phycisphaeraceae bacterium]